MTQEKWITKVEKLLALAERGGTPEEAEAAFEIAQKLMVQWSIEEAMLQQDGSSQDELVTETIDMKRRRLFGVFVDLWVAVCINNDVKILIRRPGSFQVPGVVLIGWQSDVDKVKLLWSSLMLHSQLERNRAIPDYMKQIPRWSNSAEVTRFRKSFMEGYARRINTRLRKVREATRQEATEANTSTALAIRSRSEAVDAFFAAQPKGKARSGNRKVDYEGLMSGRDAADRADLGQDRISGKKAIDKGSA